MDGWTEGVDGRKEQAAGMWNIFDCHFSNFTCNDGWINFNGKDECLNFFFRSAVHRSKLNSENDWIMTTEGPMDIDQ